MSADVDPLLPRWTDPATSLAGVRRVLTVKGRVMHAAEQLHTFNDSELRSQYEHEYETRIDRGIIARTRLTLEREGRLERLELGEHDREVRYRVTG